VEALLNFLPSAGQPLRVRFGATIALVAVFYVFSLAAGTTQGPYPYLMIGPVVLASILFDRGSGFLAAALGVGAAASLMDWRVDVVGVLAVLVLFAILALFLAAFCEALRKVLERGAVAQQSETRFRATFENAAVGIAHTAHDGRWLRVNNAMSRILGWPAAELITKSFQEITHPDDLAVELAQLEQLRDGTIDSYSVDKRYLRKNGTIVWTRRTVSCVRSSDGSIDYLVSVVEDISAVKRAEEQVRLLMREASHRAKNMLGLVQVIARQTAVGDPEGFIRRFSERIQALAANQDLLGRDERRGADLEDLVRVQLAHFADLLGSRIAVHGRKIRLNAAAAQAIGLAVHELATNAGKYGALTTDAGRVDISWRSEGDVFTIDWTERDGPPVRPPKRRGFGTAVIESMAKMSVGGKVQFDYAASGIVWRLTCPAANALEIGEKANAADREHALSATRCLARSITSDDRHSRP
jgi:PAS domain S-box-containing protein